MSPDLNIPHTEVDIAEGLLWSQRLADQEARRASDSTVETAEVMYQSFTDEKCPLISPSTGIVCNGHAVLRSRDPTNRDRREPHQSIFIGCSRYHRERRAGHMSFGIANDVDLPTIIRLFGVDRTYIHKDYMEEIGFSWNDITPTIQSTNANFK